jgi:hypothetical protein
LILELASYEKANEWGHDFMDRCVGVANNLEYDSPKEAVFYLREFVFAKPNLADQIVKAVLPA